MQQRLADLGYDPGPVDGVVGARTRAAIRAFQKDNELPETGTYVVRVSARNLATTGSYTVTRGCP